MSDVGLSAVAGFRASNCAAAGSIRSPGLRPG